MKHAPEAPPAPAGSILVIIADELAELALAMLADELALAMLLTGIA